MNSHLWKPDIKQFSVTYPIHEILRRATLKVKVYDRDIPIAYDSFGMFPRLVQRLRKLMRLKDTGIKFVKVFYEPSYFIRNYYTIRLLDPLHTTLVVKYLGIKN